MIRHNNVFKKPLFVAGLVFFGVWLVLFRMEILTNLELLFANWLPMSLGIVAIAIVAFTIIILEKSIKKKTNTSVIV